MAERNDAAVKDVQMVPSKVEFASDMGQSSNDAVSTDARIKL